MVTAGEWREKETGKTEELKGMAGPISSGDGSALVKVGDTTVGGSRSERDLGLKKRRGWGIRWCVG